MKRLLILISIFLFQNQALAQKNFIQILPDGIPIIDSLQGQYPEEQNKKINIFKQNSPLDPRLQNQLLGDLPDLFDNEITGTLKEHITNFGFNKFSLGTGAVDVTYQVKDGVKYALQDTFTGYLEFERRKITEEILNANLTGHKLTENFISGKLPDNDLNPFDILDWIFNFGGIDLNNLDGFSYPNLLGICKEIIDKEISKTLFNLMQFIALMLLLIFTIMRIIKNLRFQANDSLSKTIISAINAFLLIKFSDELLSIILEMVSLIQASILSVIEFQLNNFGNDYISLERSWEKIANNLGYLPAVILSIIDSCAQLFVYFFVIGLIIFIVIGKILSPLWSLTLISLSLRTAFIDNLLTWVKTVFSLALIPMIFMIINIMTQELSDINEGIFQVVLSIAGFIFLPFSLSLLQAKSSNLFEPAFMGYSQSLDSIRDSLNSIKFTIENQDISSKNL